MFDDEYEKVKLLGEGAFGAAYLVRPKKAPRVQQVAKEIRIAHLTDKQKEAAQAEADVLKKFHHSNIVAYITSFLEGPKLYIVMEYADGGCLADKIAQRKDDQTRFEEQDIMFIFVQVSLALLHIHEKKTVHRDLKPLNIFLTSDGIVKLGDFGIAKVMDSTTSGAQTTIGTPFYLSPEICNNEAYGVKSDLWSLGVVTFELAHLRVPFHANSLPATALKILGADPDPLPEMYSKDLQGIVDSLLKKEPKERPRLDHIIKTPYVQRHIQGLKDYVARHGTGGCESMVIGKGRLQEGMKEIEKGVVEVPSYKEDRRHMDAGSDRRDRHHHDDRPRRQDPKQAAQEEFMRTRQAASANRARVEAALREEEEARAKEQAQRGEEQKAKVRQKRKEEKEEQEAARLRELEQARLEAEEDKRQLRERQQNGGAKNTVQRLEDALQAAQGTMGPEELRGDDDEEGSVLVMQGVRTLAEQDDGSLLQLEQALQAAGSDPPQAKPKPDAEADHDNSVQQLEDALQAAQTLGPKSLAASTLGPGAAGALGLEDQDSTAAPGSGTLGPHDLDAATAGGTLGPGELEGASAAAGKTLGPEDLDTGTAAAAGGTLGRGELEEAAAAAGGTLGPSELEGATSAGKTLGPEDLDTGAAAAAGGTLGRGELEEATAGGTLGRGELELVATAAAKTLDPADLDIDGSTAVGGTLGPSELETLAGAAESEELLQEEVPQGVRTLGKEELSGNTLSKSQLQLTIREEAQMQDADHSQQGDSRPDTAAEHADDAGGEPSTEQDVESLLDFSSLFFDKAKPKPKLSSERRRMEKTTGHQQTTSSIGSASPEHMAKTVGSHRPRKESKELQQRDNGPHLHHRSHPSEAQPKKRPAGGAEVVLEQSHGISSSASRTQPERRLKTVQPAKPQPTVTVAAGTPASWMRKGSPDEAPGTHGPSTAGGGQARRPSRTAAGHADGTLSATSQAARSSSRSGVAADGHMSESHGSKTVRTPNGGATVARKEGDVASASQTTASSRATGSRQVARGHRGHSPIGSDSD